MQLVHVLACIVLIYPAVTYWRNSVPFLVGISVWALVAGALSGWMAARAEESAVDRADLAPLQDAVETALAVQRQILARLPPT